MAPRIATGRRAGRSRGFALVYALLLVMLTALASLVALGDARLDAQRERERELFFIGQQYARALASYAAATPAGQPTQPATLNDLLEDRRQPVVMRHLRRLYADPFTARADWVLVQVQGRIVALHSRSERVPLRRAGFPAGWEIFERAQTHRDWVFAATGAGARAGAPGSAGAPPTAPPTTPPTTPPNEPPTTPPTAPPGAPPAEPPGPPPAGPGSGPPGSRPPVQPPPAPPSDEAERRARCLRELSRQINVCLNLPLDRINACRSAALAEFQRCLRG